MSEVITPTSTPVADPRQAGLDALVKRDWVGAFDLLSEADRAGTLPVRVAAVAWA